tara:strand:+ start:752 stop:1177 length:426 start_codon:yes stop_codon:yes gene_type:complete
MAIKVTVKHKMSKKTQQAMNIYNKNTMRHINRIANEFKNLIQRSMVDTPKLGTVRDDGHISSIAPNPPAVDTGTLSNSIQRKPATPNRLTAEVFTNVDYGARLELVFERIFMGKGAPARKNLKAYAEKIGKDMKIGKARLQ